MEAIALVLCRMDDGPSCWGTVRMTEMIVQTFVNKVKSEMNLTMKLFSVLLIIIIFIIRIKHIHIIYSIVFDDVSQTTIDTAIFSMPIV